MIYYSKVSYTLLIIVFVVFFGPLIPNYIYSGFNSKMSFMTLALIILYVLILYMFFNTTYTIEKEKLYIKCGFFKYRPVNIMEMKKVSKSSNFISSPAASFDRIQITYTKFEEIIISPKKKLNLLKIYRK